MYLCNSFISLGLSGSNNQEENVNTSSNELPSMEVDQQSTVLSRSQIDDDIVEIER